MKQYEKPIIDTRQGEVEPNAPVVAAVVAVGIYGAVVTTGAIAAAVVVETGAVAHSGIVVK